MERRLEIYKGKGGGVVFNVDAEAGTIWATQAQLAELFEVDKTVISRHLKNIYQSGELEEGTTSAKNAIVRVEGGRKVEREVKKYNLDAIISVGYRVNSKKATDFRIWATGVLKKYVNLGVVVNEKRLAGMSGERLKEVEGVMKLMRRLVQVGELEAGEANGALEVMTRYASSFQTLGDYGRGEIKLKRGEQVRKRLGQEEILRLAEDLRISLNEGEEFGEIDKPEMLERLVELQKNPGTVAERAAELLYLAVRGRPFCDGNKRIGAFLFIVFLTFNDFNLTEGGETKISDRALVALTLLIAESERPEEGLVKALIGRLLE